MEVTSDSASPEKYFPAVFVCCAIAGGLTGRHGTGRGYLACASNKTGGCLGVCHVDVALIMLSNSVASLRRSLLVFAFILFVVPNLPVF